MGIGEIISAMKHVANAYFLTEPMKTGCPNNNKKKAQQDALLRLLVGNVPVVR